MDPRCSCRRSLYVWAVLAAAACSPAPAGGGTGTGDDPTADSTVVPLDTGASTGSMTTTTTGPGSDATAGPPTTGTSSTGQDVDPPIEFDVAGIPDAPGIADGCNAVDFLFVIDSSGSMFDKQVNLVANFPTFSAQIQETLENVTSYHVGVISTDAYAPNAPPCGALGDFVISTVGGIDSSEMVCGPYTEGYNFMTEQDDLDETFACAAQLGTFGDGSRSRSRR